MAGGSIRAGRAFLELGIDDQEFARGLDRAKSKLAGLASSVRGLGDVLAIAGVALATPLAAAAKASSDAQESFDKLSDVFGTATAKAKSFGDELAGAVGKSKVDVQDALSRFQTFFGGLGLGAEKSAELSQQLTKLAFDLASFANISDDEAISALTQAVSRGGNSLIQYGISLKGAALDQELLNSSLAESADTASLTQKALARVALLNRELVDRGVVGDAADAMQRLAGRTGELRAAVSDAASATGTVLLPILVQSAAAATDVVRRFESFVSANQGLVTAAAAVAGGFLAVGGALTGFGLAIKGVQIAVTSTSTAIALLGGATAALPIAATVVFLGALAYKLGLVDQAAEALGISFRELGNSNALAQLQAKASKFSADEIVAEIARARTELDKKKRGLEFDKELAASPEDNRTNEAFRANQEGVVAQQAKVEQAQAYLDLLTEQKKKLDEQAESEKRIALSAEAAKKDKLDAESIRSAAEEVKKRYDFEREQIEAIARAGAEATLEGHDLKMRMLEIEHQREIEDATAAGQNLALVFARIGFERKAAIADELRDLADKRKAVEQDIADAREAISRNANITVSGTFTGALAQRSLGLGGTFGTEEKQLKELEKHTQELKEINRKTGQVRAGLPVGGN